MVSEETRVVIPYTPRAVFLPYHRSPKRFTLSVAHRRAGKTVARINKLIRAAALCERPDPRFGYLAPYFVQAKDIAWNYLKHYASPVLRVDGPFKQGKPNESELSIRLPHNGAVIRLYGAENVERMRGLYFDGIAVDEAQDIAPSALTSVILPALSDRQGWLDMSGTPKGYGNLLGKTYKQALADTDWFLQVLKASATGLIPEAELTMLRKMMPDNEYLQEFECDFDAAITGAYFAKGLNDAEFDGRITRVPYDKALRVITLWDLGMADSMCIWFIQVCGKEIRVIDYYEASGYGFDHYAKVLEGKDGELDKPERWAPRAQYHYGKHYGPHDIMVRELGTGKSRWEVADGLGITFDVAPNIPVKDGIDAVRMVMNRMWWDKEKTEQGRDALKQYQEKWDEKRNVSLGPLHNWASHAADAMRIGIVALEEPNLKTKEQEDQMGHYQGAGGWMR
jgi:phage terminase large subunit